MPEKLAESTQAPACSQAPTCAPSAACAQADSLPKHWLVCRLSALGDVTLLSGVLDYWHRTRGWSFTLLTKSQNAPVFSNHPALREIVGLEPEDLRNLRPRLKELARRFAAENPPAGLLDLHGTLRSRLLGWYWKGPVRRYPKFSLERRLFLRGRSPRRAAKLRALNVPQRYALAVESAAPPPGELLPKIYLSQSEKGEAAALLGQLFPNILPEKIKPVILHPYATHARKEWPRAHWLELAALLNAAAIPFMVVGQGEKVAGLAELANQAELAKLTENGRDLSNATSLRQLCALLQRGALLVTGDSGPMHLALGVGLPVLGLFGPTTREWGFFPPAGSGRALELDLPCRPCSLHGKKACPGQGECMSALSPKLVFENIRQMLEEA